MAELSSSSGAYGPHSNSSSRNRPSRQVTAGWRQGATYATLLSTRAAAPSARSQAPGADPLGWLKPADVNANYGVAAGRDIRDSPINFFGLDEEGVRRVVQEEPIRIAGEKGVPLAPLQAVLAKLGEAGIPDHEILARLDVAADELIDLRAQLARLMNGSTGVRGDP